MLRLLLRRAFHRVSPVVAPAALGSILLLGGCRLPTAPASEHRPAPVWRTTNLGLCEDYPEETRSLVNARRDLEVARDAGAKSLRIAFGWDAMEPAPGRYDWSFWDDFIREAQAARIQLIPYVCYTPRWAAQDQGPDFWRSPPRDPADFARFVEALVRRYRGSMRTWELWNEPDNRAYWLGSPAEFAEMIRLGSAAVRRADPEAKVVLGGIAGEVDFLAALLVQERIGAAVDIINIHSYFETWHPNPIEQLPNYVESVAGLVRDTGGQQPVWMAETGYSSVGGRAETSSVYRRRYHGEHTEEAQADALARTLATALATQHIELFAWYRINDLASGEEVIGDDNNHHLGVLRANGQPKPALRSFGYLARLFGQPYAVFTPRVRVLSRTGDAQPETRGFQLRDGRWLVFAWMSMPDGPAPVRAQPDDRAAQLEIIVPGARANRFSVRNAQGSILHASASRPEATRDGLRLTLALTGGDVRVVELTP